MIISMSVTRPESFLERAGVVIGDLPTNLNTDYHAENQAILLVSSMIERPRQLKK